MTKTFKNIKVGNMFRVYGYGNEECVFVKTNKSNAICNNAIGNNAICIYNKFDISSIGEPDHVFDNEKVGEVEFHEI